MTDLNEASLCGRLGSDPVSRTTRAGGDVVTFSIATSDRWTDSNGDRQERTEWHMIVIYNENIGKTAMRFLRKGSRCLVKGRVQTRKYTDRDGHEKKITEIVMQKYDGFLQLLDGRQDDAQRQREQRTGKDAAAGDLDDDVPF